MESLTYSLSLEPLRPSVSAYCFAHLARAGPTASTDDHVFLPMQPATTHRIVELPSNTSISPNTAEWQVVPPHARENSLELRLTSERELRVAQPLAGESPVSRPPSLPGPVCAQSRQ